MRITRIEVTPLSVPFLEPFRWRYGTMRGITTALVRIATDAGIEGLGEAPGVPGIGLVREALDFFARSLVGEDPFGVRRLAKQAHDGGAEHFPYVANVALGALEMALWDVCGKALDTPVHQLFGGLTTSSVPFYWHVSSADGSEEAAVASAREGLRRGFTTLYMKGGIDALHDLETMRALRRAAGPQIALRLDPNEGWSPLDALRHRDLLREVGLEFLEEPFPMRDLASAKELRTFGGIPVGANQSAWFLDDVRAVLDARAADVIVTGIHQVGGLLNLDLAERLCRLGGIPLVRHSLCDLGVSTAAALQLLGTWSPSGYAHQTHLTLVEHDLLADPLRFVEGRLDVPTGAGLGVELDEGAVERFAKRFREQGEDRSYEDAAADRDARAEQGARAE